METGSSVLLGSVVSTLSLSDSDVFKSLHGRKLVSASVLTDALFDALSKKDL